MKIYSYKNKVIFLIVMLFSLLFSLNFFGYGVDYYSLHYKTNNFTKRIDGLSILIISLEYFSFRIGLFLHAFIHVISLTKLFSLYVKSKLLLILILISTVSWPVLMNISNTMRQGMLVTLINYIFYLVVSRGGGLSDTKIILLSLPMVLLHRSGIIFTVIILIATLSKKYKILTFFSPIIAILLASILSYIMLKLEYSFDGQSKLIGINLNYLFLILHIVILIGFAFKIYKKGVNYFDFIDFFFLYFISTSFVFLLFGMRWEYDRLNMIVFFPMIIFILKMYKFRVSQGLTILIIILFIASLSLGHIDLMTIKNAHNVPE
jgi:hypothetical protein